jgi:hypothetical protein
MKPDNFVMEEHSIVRQISSKKRHLHALIAIVLTLVTSGLLLSNIGLISALIFAFFGLAMTLIILRTHTERVLTSEGKRAIRDAEAHAYQKSSEADSRFLLAVYRLGFALVWIGVFFGSWAYCVLEYGYLFGVGLGWLPSLIVATLAAFLWPILAFAIGFFLYLNRQLP